MNSTETETVIKPVAAAQIQVLKLGEGLALANRLNKHIKRVVTGQVKLDEAIALAAKCDSMLADIFETRTLTFEKVTDQETGKDRAPEFNRVKAAINTLRARLSERFPEHIPARATKAAEVGARFGV